MSAIKTSLIIAAAAGVITFAAAGVLHECVLNVKLSKQIGEKLKSGKKPAIPSVKKNHSADDWFKNLALTDYCIYDENTKRTHAYIIDSSAPTDKWVIILHGYTSDPNGVKAFAKEYHDMGFNCILPSLRGHCNDENRYCSMGYYDKFIAIAWIKHILSLNKDARIIIHGVSMGAATTMLTTGESLPDNVKAAVSDCGYASCYEEYKYMIKNRFHIPTFPILDATNLISIAVDKFNFKKAAPVEAVKSSKTPTLFIHGSNDDFVPSFMLDEVYSACSAEKEKLLIDGAGHSESYIVEPEKYWNTVKEFINRYL